MAEWQQNLDRRLGLRAFVDLEYIDSGRDGSRGGDSTFDSHHVQMFLDSQLRENLTAHAELEWEHSGDEVEVDQAFVAWAVHEMATIDFGRFYTPFGIERFVWYSPTNALVSRPSVMRDIVPNNFYANGIRVGGATEPGSPYGWNYEVAVSNGLGAGALENRRGSRQARDDDSNKALSGRLAWSADGRLEIGASIHDQDFGQDQHLRFTGLDLAARWQGFELRTEYVEAELDRAPGATLAPPTLQQNGFYTQLSYTRDWDRALLPSLTLVTRYDDVDLDESTNGRNDRRAWSLGVNAAVYWRFRLKAEYQFALEDGVEKDDDTVFFQAVVDF